MSTRRQFLAVTSMSAVAAAALGPKLFAAPAASVARAAVGIAPIGGGPLADAATVLSADGAFIGRGARVAFCGAYNASRVSEFLANFPYFNGSQKRVAPFRVWARGGNGVGFVMPADLEQKLSFSIVAGGATVPVVLSLQSDRNALKLVRGVYVVVPQSSKESAPRWADWELRDGMIVDAAGRRAPFEHFVLRADYAS